jgi:hypothetical protein
MLVTGPAPVVFTPSTAAINIDSVAFDMNAHVYTVSYRNSDASGQKTTTGAIPAAILTALQTALMRAIEVKEGWAVNSAVLTTP